MVTTTISSLKNLPTKLTGTPRILSVNAAGLYTKLVTQYPRGVYVKVDLLSGQSTGANDV